jgi:hypothetical protein
MEAPKLDPDWEPVTVFTKTKEIPVQCPSGQTLVPIQVPEVQRNEVVTMTETVTTTETLNPDPQEIELDRTFHLDYSRRAAHLLKNWLILGAFATLATLGTSWGLKQRDLLG